MSVTKSGFFTKTRAREAGSKVLRTLQSEFPFVKEWKEEGYHYTRKLLKKPHEKDFYALQALPDDGGGVYLDIGANHGQSIEAISIFKPNVRIHSFEPNGLLARKLVKRYRGQDNVEIHGYGLSDRVDSATLYVPIYKKFIYDGLASFDRTSAEDWLNDDRLFLFSPEDLEIREVPCESRRLDDLDLRPSFVKIDVQGFEYQVCQGGLETLKAHQPVLMIEDFHGSPKLIELLTGVGYRPFEFSLGGFRATERTDAVNTFLLTPSRIEMLRRRAVPIAA